MKKFNVAAVHAIMIFAIMVFIPGLAAIEAAEPPGMGPDQKAINALKDHLIHGLNGLGLPKSYLPVKGYPHILVYPDRSYTFDSGALVMYVARDPVQWGKYIHPVIEALLKLQNADGMWARSYDNAGISEDGLYAGPAAVLARGLLNWGMAARDPQDRIEKAAVAAALKTADFLLNEANQIKVSKYYVVKQVTGIQRSAASPEENARVALFFIDLYAYFAEKKQKTEALRYLNAAENILAGVSCLRKELFPFGIRDDGTANWEMPDREGVEGQSAMLQALYAYFKTPGKDRAHEPETVLKNAYAGRYEILAWIEKTHRHQNSVFKDIHGKSVAVPLSFSKKISPEGKAAPQMWLEFMARMALTYHFGFGRDEPYRQLLTAMILLQQPGGFFPYAVGFDGYARPPAWPVGSDQQNLNVPFGSMIATVEFLFAFQGPGHSPSAQRFIKFP